MTFDFLDTSAVNRPGHPGQTLEQAAIHQQHFIQAFKLVGPTLFLSHPPQRVKNVTPNLEGARGIGSAKTRLIEGERFASYQAVKAEHFTQITLVAAGVKIIEFL